MKNTTTANLFRYLRGGILGMCLEYLYRVGYNPITMWICILLALHIILDLDTKWRIKLFWFKIWYHMLGFYVWLVFSKKR